MSKQTADLLDLDGADEHVTVQGRNIPVYGVSTHGVTSLMKRFPAMRSALQGQEVEITSDLVFDTVPDAVAAVIAAACGHPDNDDAEKVAARLPLHAQTDLLDAAIRLTMPDGAGPLGDRLQALGERLGLSTDETASSDQTSHQCDSETVEASTASS
jgi:hypothetical protein